MISYCIVLSGNTMVFNILTSHFLTKFGFDNKLLNISYLPWSSFQLFTILSFCNFF